MASVKISNLPQITEWTLPSVLPIVDSGSTVTSKIDLTSLFRASGSTISGTIGQNNIILGSSNSQIIDTATGSGTGDNAILASTSSTIEKDQGASTAIIASNDARISNDVGEGAMNAIIASYGNIEIEGGFANGMMASSNGSFIQRGERNAIIGGAGPQIYGGGNQVAIATNGWQMNYGYNNFVAACESGAMGNHRYSAVIGNYQFGETDAGNQCFVAAGENTRLESRGGFASWKSIVSGKDTTSQDEGAAMISTSGRSSNYPWTLHTDNLYAFERVQSETNITTTVANVQTLTGGLGMVQYTDVAAGNLNLQINDVRNGEVYHWVIENTSGGSISLNSSSTNTVFTILQDIGGGSFGNGAHLFTIVVVNNKIIISHPH